MEAYNKPVVKNEKRGKKISWKGKIVLVVILIFVLLLCLCMCHDNSRDNNGNITFGVIDTIGTAEVALQKMANDVVSANEFQVFINTDAVVGASGNIDFCIQNSKTNHYPCYVEITEGGETLYTSGIIRPGYKLERDTLDSPLLAGAHDCIAYFHILQDDEKTEINKVGVNMVITSK